MHSNPQLDGQIAERKSHVAVVRSASANGIDCGGEQMIIAGQRCPLCGGFGTEIGTKSDVVIRACCGNLLAWAWDSEAEYSALYTSGDAYHVHRQIAEGQCSYWERDDELYRASRLRIPFIRLLRKDSVSLADIGSGTGAFLVAAKENGFEAIGLEPNVQLCERAISLGRAMVVGDWSQLAGTYDVITLFDVFEHLTRPKQALAFLLRRLNPGGLLVIEMPEAGCGDYLREGLGWKHIRPLQHVCIWSERSFDYLARSCGGWSEMMTRPLAGRLGKICFYLQRAD